MLTMSDKLKIRSVRLKSFSSLRVDVRYKEKLMALSRKTTGRVNKYVRCET